MITLNELKTQKPIIRFFAKKNIKKVKDIKGIICKPEKKNWKVKIRVALWHKIH